MTAKSFLTLLLLLLAANAQITIATTDATTASYLPSMLPCVQYQNGNCVICPYNYHISWNQCYKNITGCLVYGMTSQGTEECVQCNSNVGRADGNGGCSITASSSSLTSEAMSAAQVSAQYGDNRFVLISLEAAQADAYFRICNEFMLRGQYKHFIALSSAQPVLYVSFFSVGAQRQYKILYNGSGGGIMMCLITINAVQDQSSKPRINAFVPIGAGNIIDNCAIYSQQMQCTQCASGWHLENGQCFVNFGGCVAYIQQICIECQKTSILVENKCIVCVDMSDLCKMHFFRGGFGGSASSADQSYIYSS